MGVFFLISKRKTEKKGKGERNIFFRGTSQRPVRISTSQENINCWLTLLTSSKQKLALRDWSSFIPLWGEWKGAWTIQMANVKVFFYFFIYFFFLTALLTITHITYSKLNSQEKKWNICAKWFKVIRSKGKVRTGREDPCEAPPMVQIIIKTRSTKRRQI